MRYWDSEEREAPASEKKPSGFPEMLKVLMTALGVAYIFRRIKSWLGRK